MTTSRLASRLSRLTVDGSERRAASRKLPIAFNSSAGGSTSGRSSSAGAPVRRGRHGPGRRSGDSPTRRLNCALNEPRLEKPTAKQTSVTELAGAQQRFGALHPPGHQVLVRRLAERRLEAAAEVGRRHGRAAGERGDVEVLGVGAVDEVAHPEQVPRERDRRSGHGSSVPPVTNTFLDLIPDGWHRGARGRCRCPLRAGQGLMARRCCREPTDEEYGQREYGLQDPEGHNWYIATPT